MKKFLVFMNNFHYNVKQQKEGIIMSVENVRAYLKKFNKDQDIIELDASTATVELAAEALGTQPAGLLKPYRLRFRTAVFLWSAPVI